jgi:hypothetical protein
MQRLESILRGPLMVSKFVAEKREDRLMAAGLLRSNYDKQRSPKE